MLLSLGLQSVLHGWHHKVHEIRRLEDLEALPDVLHLGMLTARRDPKPKTPNPTPAKPTGLLVLGLSCLLGFLCNALRRFANPKP